MYLRSLIFLAFGICLAACGRYGPLVAPELLASQAVRNLEVTGDINGVTLKWEAPENDLRGHQLQDLKSYVLYRAQVMSAGDTGSAESFSFEELAKVDATSALQAVGKPAKKARSFQLSFLDNAVRNGSTYVYKVVPLSERRGDGQVDRFARVVYSGAASEVRMMAALEDKGEEVDPYEDSRE